MPLRPRKQLLVPCVALAVFAALAAIPARLAAAASAPSPRVDFDEIWRLSEAYRTMRYDSLAAIHAELDSAYDELVVVDLAATQNRYMLGTIEKSRRQEIWIRGTANTKNLLTDLEFAKRRDPRLGINLHRGCAANALAVYQDLLPRLSPGYELVLFGHSLGAAEATILGMLLTTDGRKVTRVYASGSLRITDAEGARKFADLPVLRIINEGDPIPLLPPCTVVSPSDPYVHLGPAVLLLDGPWYCLPNASEGDEALGAEVWKMVRKDGLLVDVREHYIMSYLERLASKRENAVLVPYADRTKYLPPKGGIH